MILTAEQIASLREREDSWGIAGTTVGCLLDTIADLQQRLEASEARENERIAQARLEEAKFWIAAQHLKVSDLIGEEEKRYAELEAAAAARKGQELHPLS